MIRKVVKKGWHGAKRVARLTKMVIFGWALVKGAKTGAKVAKKAAKKGKKIAK